MNLNKFTKAELISKLTKTNNNTENIKSSVNKTDNIKPIINNSENNNKKESSPNIKMKIVELVILIKT
jgi:hypothetical protein